MISVVIVFLNNSVWKNYMNTRFFTRKKKDKFFIVGCKKTNEGGLLL
jgi:hypothetical protein